MKQDQDFERMLRTEIKDILPNTIWRNDNGVYSVFGHYCIEPVHPGYRVYCAATEVGVFNSTRTALSWCIADKNQAYNLARELLELDLKLATLTADITVRTAVGEHSTDWKFRDNIGTKLETKIIRRKQVEQELAKCVNWAKYVQQRGFNNETARTSRNQPNKAVRPGL